MATGALLSSETEDATAIQFTLDELRAAVEIARDNHKHVAAHCHALAGIENAVEAGVDSIEHCTFADDAVLRKMADRGTSLVPTICAGELLFRDEAVVGAMPPHLRERMEAFNDVHIAAVRRAHELGVTIAMGTDAGTPGNHHGLNAHECVFLVEQCGLTPAESIATATVNAARLLRQTRARLAPRGRPRRRDRVRRNPLDDITDAHPHRAGDERRPRERQRPQFGSRPLKAIRRSCSVAPAGTMTAASNPPGRRIFSSARAR